MEHLKTELKTAHYGIDLNSEKVKNSEEKSEALWDAEVLNNFSC